jgi:hypothetical protein
LSIATTAEDLAKLDYAIKKDDFLQKVSKARCEVLVRAIPVKMIIKPSGENHFFYDKNSEKVLKELEKLSCERMERIKEEVFR